MLLNHLNEMMIGAAAVVELEQLEEDQSCSPPSHLPKTSHQPSRNRMQRIQRDSLLRTLHPTFIKLIVTSSLTPCRALCASVVWADAFRGSEFVGRSRRRFAATSADMLVWCGCQDSTRLE